MQKQRFNTTKTLILSILLWISSIRLLRVNCLNVDTKFPLFYHHNQKGSHFGYTVTFHRNRTSMWAMVAAPKANSTSLPSSVIESGSVYKCDLSLSSNSCQEVIFETTGNDLTLRARNSAFSYTDMKNHMWLGVSMDSGHGNFMACAHLWKNKIHKKLYLSNGLCYVINENLEKRSTMRLIPLVDRNEQAVNNVYKYAFGLAGMSSTFTDTGLLLGAPGISNYIGSNVFYEIDDPSQPYRITESYVPDVLFDTVNINSYFGYSVASGKFYNDRLTYHVSGAPKEGEIGRVFIYESLDYNKRSMLIKEKKQGFQIGEYFGSTITVTDVNNDKYDDLIVGSPFYSSKTIGDHGRVYVYISNGKSLTYQDETFFGSNKLNARFGSAISAIGDINQDGFNDVVIGAPYEDGVGAIYVYHGYEFGIRPTFSQRITAKEINSELRGFGISIARGDDVDKNKYNDILIGSYQSDHVVLLRTKPVIHVSAYIKFDVPFLDLNHTKCFLNGFPQPCFNTEICLTYTGRHVSEYVEFDLLFDMETLRKQDKQTPRGYMLVAGRPLEVVKYPKLIYRDRYTCEKYEVHIYKSTKDLATPVQFKLTYNLTEKKTSEFLPDQPIMDTSLGNSVTNQLLLQTNCGFDNLCNADLELRMGILNMQKEDSLVIGAQADVTLYLDVRNVNETAIHSIVHVEFPKDISIINLGGCVIPGETTDVTENSEGDRTNSNKVLICKTAVLLERGQKERFLIKLGILGLKPQSHLSVTAEASTKSAEINLENNIVKLDMPVIALADITIVGSTKTNEIIYEDEKQHRKESVSLSHSYEVIKSKPSPIKRVKVELAFPVVSDDGLSIIKFKNVEVSDDSSGNVGGSCDTRLLPFVQLKQTDGDDVGDDILNEDTRYKAAKLTGNDDILEQKLEGKGRERRSTDAVSKNVGDKYDIKRQMQGYYLNCSNVQCVVIVCYLGPFVDNLKTGKIDVTFDINITSVLKIPFLKDQDTVIMSSNGIVSIKDRGVTAPMPRMPKSDNVYTKLISNKRPPTKGIANWIIIVSVIAGIFVLLLILFILVKLGFFKRTIRENMHKMKAKAEMDELERLMVKDSSPPKS